MNQVPGLDDGMLLSFFVSRLSMELRSIIQLHWPASLHQAMQFAFPYDALRSSFNSLYKKQWWKSTTSTTTATSTTLPAPSSLPIKLSPEELKKKRELGLCYSCDEKWSMGHRCKAKMLLLMADPEDNLTDGEEQIVWCPEESTTMIQEGFLNSLSMHSNNPTMQLEALIVNKVVGVLVDSGSSHNFIQRELALELGIPLTQTRTMKVVLGNGQFLLCNTKCCDVSIFIQDKKFEVELWTLDLKHHQVILGMPWLESLGRVTHDYKEMTMEFIYNKERVLLQSCNMVAAKQSSCLEPDSISSIKMGYRLQIQEESGRSLNAERLPGSSDNGKENHWHNNLEQLLAGKRKRYDLNERLAGKRKRCDLNVNVDNNLECSWPLFTETLHEEDSDRTSDSDSDAFSGPS